MPTDGNGNYSLPAAYLATAGLPILPAQHNPIFEDVAAALTGRLSVNGANAMTGPLKLADGAVGTPALTFANATNTGLYKTTAGFAAAVAGVKVVEFGAGGIIQGARYIGEIFDWTGSTAPALCVLPYGQTLSRTAYADLWTFAQIEIAAGNTLYNNGNGSTTFGIGDCRGRVRAAKDNMGGSPAGRLTTTVSPNGNTLGAVGGVQAQSMVTANMPPYTPQVQSLTGGVVSFPATQSASTAGGAANGVALGSQIGAGNLTTIFNPSQTPLSLTMQPQGGVGASFSTISPTIITNCALFAGA